MTTVTMEGKDIYYSFLNNNWVYFDGSFVDEGARIELEDHYNDVNLTFMDENRTCTVRCPPNMNHITLKKTLGGKDKRIILFLYDDPELFRYIYTEYIDHTSLYLYISKNPPFITPAFETNLKTNIAFLSEIQNHNIKTLTDIE